MNLHPLYLRGYGLPGKVSGKFLIYFFQMNLKEKLTDNNQRAKSSRHFFTPFGTFPHIFKLPRLFLRIKGFYCCFSSKRRKRPNENIKKNTKPFCMLVVACLSSSEDRPPVQDFVGRLHPSRCPFFHSLSTHLIGNIPMPLCAESSLAKKLF